MGGCCRRPKPSTAALSRAPRMYSALSPFLTKICRSYTHSCYSLSSFTGSWRTQRQVGTTSLHSLSSLQFLFLASPAGEATQASPAALAHGARKDPQPPALCSLTALHPQSASNCPPYVSGWGALHLLKARPTLNGAPSHPRLLGLG